MNLLVHQRRFQLQRAKVTLVVFFYFKCRQKLRIEIARGKAKTLAAVTTNDLSDVSRPYRINRLRHSTWPMIVGGNGQRPVAQTLIVCPEQPSRCLGRNQWVTTVINDVVNPHLI